MSGDWERGMPSELETGRGANQVSNDNAGSSTRSVIASASRLGESNKFTPRPVSVFEPVSWLEVLIGRLPVRVARRVQTAIGVIFGAVGVLFGALSVLAL
jgi:hypothetical protein